MRRQIQAWGEVWQGRSQTIFSTTFSGRFKIQMTMLDCRSEESSGNIYEKYNCTGAGRPGGGGEYDVQVIFNWVGHMMSKAMSPNYHSHSHLHCHHHHQQYHQPHQRCLIAGRFWMDQWGGSQSSGKVSCQFGFDACL